MSNLGRPPRPPNGPRPEINALASWLHDQLALPPRITQQQVAERLSQSLGRTVWKGTVSSWLNGRKEPPQELIDAIIALRTQGTGALHDAGELTAEALRLQQVVNASRRARRTASLPRPVAPTGAATAVLGDPALPAARQAYQKVQQLQSQVRQLEAERNDLRELARQTTADAEEHVAIAKAELANALLREDKLGADRAALEAEVQDLRHQNAVLRADSEGKGQDIQRLANDAVRMSIENVELQAHVEELEARLAASDNFPGALESEGRDQQMRSRLPDSDTQTRIELAAAYAKREELVQQAQRELEAARELRSRAAREAFALRADAQRDVQQLERARDKLAVETADLRELRRKAMSELADLDGALDSTLTIPTSAAPNKVTIATLQDKVAEQRLTATSVPDPAFGIALGPQASTLYGPDNVPREFDLALQSSPEAFILNSSRDDYEIPSPTNPFLKISASDASGSGARPHAGG